MDYIELDCSILPKNKGLDVVIAALGEIGFESFEETENGVKAYIQVNSFSESDVENCTYLKENDYFSVSFKRQLIKAQNWNQVWESNFDPIVMPDVCIRAPFHPPVKDIRYDIIIEPKMSFGTGHHETTSLMVEEMLAMNFLKKNVLDMGCGTGILAILAKKMGAEKVTAVDIDEWAYNNSNENIVRNNTSEINVIHGDIESLGEQKFDIILANINRNILLKDVPRYYQLLSPNGTLVMSGFLDVDLAVITEASNKTGLAAGDHKAKNHWTIIKCYKS